MIAYQTCDFIEDNLNVHSSSAFAPHTVSLLHKRGMGGCCGRQEDRRGGGGGGGNQRASLDDEGDDDATLVICHLHVTFAREGEADGTDS